MSVADLPTLNAALNATSGILLVIGFVLIKERPYRRAPADDDRGLRVLRPLFLTSYVIYHARSDRSRLPGTGIARTIYFSILVPHVILAAAVAAAGDRHAAARPGSQRRGHRRIAKITLPIWLFVSVTGVVVYLMLYHW